MILCPFLLKNIATYKAFHLCRYGVQFQHHRDGGCNQVSVYLYYSSNIYTVLHVSLYIYNRKSPIYCIKEKAKYGAKSWL